MITGKLRGVKINLPLIAKQTLISHMLTIKAYNLFMRPIIMNIKLTSNYMLHIYMRRQGLAYARVHDSAEPHHLTISSASTLTPVR